MIAPGYVPMRRHIDQSGYTLLELLITIVISSIILLSIHVFMMETQRSWSDSYAKIHGGAVSDGVMARTAFNRIVRKSSQSNHQLTASDDLKVYYYADWQTSTRLDRMARFYRSETDPSEMYVEHATVDDNQIFSTVLLATSVTDLEFLPIDDGYTMKLCLDDGREHLSVVSTAIFNNP